MMSFPNHPDFPNWWDNSDDYEDEEQAYNPLNLISNMEKTITEYQQYKIDFANAKTIEEKQAIQDAQIAREYEQFIQDPMHNECFIDMETGQGF